jgi:hypothetical protein
VFVAHDIGVVVHSRLRMHAKSLEGYLSPVKIVALGIVSDTIVFRTNPHYS